MSMLHRSLVRQNSPRRASRYSRGVTTKMVVEVLEARQLMTDSTIQLSIAPTSDSGLATLKAGVAAKYTVTAEDAQGNTETNYSDYVHFTSSDPNAIVPLDLKLTNGTAIVRVIYTTVGHQTVSVADEHQKNINSTSQGVVITPAAAVALSVSAPSNVQVGAPATVTVTALDSYGNTVIGDSNAVKLTSTDAKATLPTSFNLVDGTATTAVTFSTPGKKTISAAESPANSVAGASAGIVAGQIIQGVVYLDQAALNKFVSSDPLLSGRVVYLDLQGDGQFDSSDPTTTTDAQGHFAFPSYPAGSAVVRENTVEDSSNRNVVNETAFASDGTVRLGVVPISPIVPLPILPNPFGPVTTTDSGANYVQSLYRSILGRDGADSEIAAWVSAMQSGMTQAQVASLFLVSPEHLGNEIDDDYEHFLGHAPDAPSAAKWVALMASGAMNEVQVVEWMLDSPEYQSDYPSNIGSAGSLPDGSSNQFLKSLYLNVLGRQPDPTSLAASNAAMVAGTPASEIIDQIVESGEATDAIVDSFYSAFLRTKPDFGAQAWANLLESKVATAATVEQDFLGSDAYAALVAAMKTTPLAPTTTPATSGTTWYTTHLATPAIASTVQADMLADGQLTRTDMLNLFKQVEQAGKVTANEFNDLKSIVKNTTVVAMSPSVRNLSEKLVDGSRANNKYLGKPLGNLKVDSSSAQLSKLVDKWFLGLDLPIAKSTDDTTHVVTTYKYATAQGSLFGSTGQAGYSQVIQGESGDCYFLSSLASMTLHSPQQSIDNMIVDNHDGTYTVRFYDVKNGVATPDYVTVNSQLPVDDGKYVFANEDRSISNKSVALWPALIEKAYVQWNAEGHNAALDPKYWVNSYDEDGIGHGSDRADEMIQALTGDLGYDLMTPSSSSSSSSKYPHFLKSQFATIANAFAAGSNVICSSIGDGDTPSVPLDTAVASSHDYALISVDVAHQTLTMYNPWGLGGGDDDNQFKTGLVKIKWSDMGSNFDMIAYRPTSTS